MLLCPRVLSGDLRAGLVWVSAKRKATTTTTREHLERFCSPFRALVVGNNNYMHLPKLRCCEQDADDVSTALERIGYSVTCEKNRTAEAMNADVERFVESMPKQGNIVLYFSGHGFAAPRSYLAGVDAQVSSPYGAWGLWFNCQPSRKHLSSCQLCSNFPAVLCAVPSVMPGGLVKQAGFLALDAMLHRVSSSLTDGAVIAIVDACRKPISAALKSGGACGDGDFGESS